jgi:hypothetical protein
LSELTFQVASFRGRNSGESAQRGADVQQFRKNRNATGYDRLSPRAPGRVRGSIEQVRAFTRYGFG